MTSPCIIIGASHAAVQLALQVRQQGWQNDIVLIGNEPHLPYQRPPLSKTFLSDDKQLLDILLKPAAVYEKANIKFRLNTQVTETNRSEKVITLDNGEKLAYEKLALCTGASANKIPLSNNKLSGVHYLRNHDDAISIRAEIATGKNAVIIGAGFIGLEIAAVLSQKGMNITVLENQESILQRVVSPEVSTYISELHKSHGVNIETQCMAEVLEGNDKVTGVRCSSGKLIPADLVVIGVGVQPRTALAEQCGLIINNGIAVDAYAQTNDPDIVAAGDCTCYFHTLYQRNIRVESIQNALEQAKSAAMSIVGKQLAFNSNVPRFWSDQYDKKLQIAGIIDGYDQIELQQDPDTKIFKALYLKAGKVLAAIAVNHPKFLMKAQFLIKSQQELTMHEIKSLFTA